jgi:hypothetical protein
MEEELEPVSRIDPQAIPDSFGDRHLSFTTEHSFHNAGVSCLYILAKVKRIAVDPSNCFAPGFNQRPIECGEQQQRAAELLEALFDFGEVVEVIEQFVAKSPKPARGGWG